MIGPYERSFDLEASNVIRRSIYHSSKTVADSVTSVYDQ